jgi:hypothetical protein
MTTGNLRVAPPQQIGPLQVWPLLWESLSPHQYKISPQLSELEFAECEEDEELGVDIGWIQVHNPTDMPILIPSGWLLSEGLFQERTLNFPEYIGAHETKELKVSCVEKNRWKEDSSTRPIFRAPLSVMTAGFNYEHSKGMWILNPETRQDQVWAQIERFEVRTGHRMTSSLTQIMEEDSKVLEVQKQITEQLKSNFNTYPRQNGFLIALNGQPLLSEFFSNPEGIHRTIKKTIVAASFDVSETRFNGICKRQVIEFLDQVRSTKIQQISEEEWGSHFSGGNEQLDAHLTKSPENRVMRISIINRGHDSLSEI